jgi:hypothetical protein
MRRASKSFTLTGVWLLVLFSLIRGQSPGAGPDHAEVGNNTATVQTPAPQTAPTPASSPTPVPSPTPDDPATKKPNRGTFIFAPIPISSPTFGSGLILGAGYVFKLRMDDEKSPPSTIGIATAFTNSGSRGGGIAGRFYFAENTYQAGFVFVKGRANFDFYGIGHIPGRDPIIVPLKAGGTVFFAEFMRNIGHNIFIGPRFQRRNLYARLDGAQTPGGFEVPPIDAKSISAALGVHLHQDKRDNSFFPTKGSLFSVTADFFDEAFGSRRAYQVYKMSYSGYRQMREKRILAYQAVVCSANGSVPFYDLCLYGSNNQLRGYVTGQYQDRRMFAAQAEYRIELPKRFGLVGFGGVGGIARCLNDFLAKEFLRGG